MLTTYQKQARTKLITTIVIIVVIAGIVLVADHLKSKGSSAIGQLNPTTSTTTPAADTSTDTTIDSSSSTSSSASTSSLKDGTYTASSSYFVPAGQETIQVSVTLKDGVITGSSIQNSESDHDSALFQEEFASNYKSFVIGRKISGLQISSVAGASDTTQGFNEALNQIASKAQA